MFKYPVEVLSDVYLSKIGGFSPEIDINEIGINSKALSMNTSIIANETVAVLRILDRKGKPYFLDKRFLIIGIEEWMDCYELSSNGEVVLSSELEDDFSKFLGRGIIINTIESFRIGRDYGRIIKILMRFIDEKKQGIS